MVLAALGSAVATIIRNKYEDDTVSKPDVQDVLPENLAVDLGVREPYTDSGSVEELVWLVAKDRSGFRREFFHIRER